MKAREQFFGNLIPVLNNAVTFENISFSYADHEVLNDVSFSIPVGKITAITGPSGIGKTTIADILTGLVKAQSGMIYVDDLPMNEIDFNSWRQMVGYVPQETFLFNESIYINLTLGDNQLTREKAELALEKAGALDFISKLPCGQDRVLGVNGANISGGQRQRISLARALIRNPRLLILDEVTTALDPEAEAAICETLLKLRDDMAILVISHQSALIKLADNVLQIREKKLYPIT